MLMMVTDVWQILMLVIISIEGEKSFSLNLQKETANCDDHLQHAEFLYRHSKLCRK
jgi:hypothetical protein